MRCRIWHRRSTIDTAEDSAGVTPCRRTLCERSVPAYTIRPPQWYLMRSVRCERHWKQGLIHAVILVIPSVDMASYRRKRHSAPDSKAEAEPSAGQSHRSRSKLTILSNIYTSPLRNPIELKQENLGSCDQSDGLPSAITLCQPRLAPCRPILPILIAHRLARRRSDRHRP